MGYRAAKRLSVDTDLPPKVLTCFGVRLRARRGGCCGFGSAVRRRGSAAVPHSRIMPVMSKRGVISGGLHAS